MPNDDAHSDPPMPWETESLGRVQFLLSDAKWDPDRQEVCIPSEEAGGHYPTFNSLEEFRQYLVDQYTSVWYGAAPSEGGGAVFDSMDEVDIVNEELSEYENQIESLGWEL
ncbi:MAG: hypothetical protein P1P90_04120 [Patescibacteria group bacterium]|nr:hypothetical protein [Patescibacteria group bacterium]